MEDITKKRGFPFYPRFLKMPDGNEITVKDHIEHGKRIGKKVMPDATIVEPPTLETVMAAGYAEDAAKGIVAQEREKFDKGYPPYGDNESPATQANTQEPEKSNLDEPEEELANTWE